MSDDRSELLELNQELSDLIDNVNDVIYSHDLEGNFISVNRAGRELFGYTRAEILGMNIKDIIDAAHLPVAIEKIREKTSGHSYKSQPYELLCWAREGREVWLEVSTRILGDRISGIGRDITERRAYRSKLEELSIRDGLTGLYNHKYFWETLIKEAAKAERYGRPMSLLVTDIDELQRFNDRYGHDLGDHVLKALAALIREGIREVDSGCRHGGEEFTVILPEAGLDEAAMVAERLRRDFESLEYEILDKTVGKTISLGVAQYMEGEGAEGLFRRAKQALHAAKADGKNRVGRDEAGGS